LSAKSPAQHDTVWQKKLAKDIFKEPFCACVDTKACGCEPDQKK